MATACVASLYADKSLAAHQLKIATRRKVRLADRRIELQNLEVGAKDAKLQLCSAGTERCGSAAIEPGCSRLTSTSKRVRQLDFLVIDFICLSIIKLFARLYIIPRNSSQCVLG